MAQTINPQAQHGFAKASEYDRHRPSYTPSATQDLLEQTRVAGKNGARILDLAAGTGKLTDVLALREEGYKITAVEPHDGMRQVLEQKKLPNVDVLSGTATSIPLENESVDTVVIAQAFHWFSTEEALKEIHRVLRPHGVVGMIWNIEDYNAPRSHKATTEWEQTAHDLIWTFDDNEPRFRHEKWRRVFDEQLKSTPLSLLKAQDQLFSLPLGESTEAFEVWLTKDAVWERFSTLSQIAMLEGEDRERARTAIADSLNKPETKTNEKGEVAVHGNTYIVWSTKIPEDGRQSLTGVETAKA